MKKNGVINNIIGKIFIKILNSIEFARIIKKDKMQAIGIIYFFIFLII
jgi:DNA topoisomerase VI subunit B|tara:strand:+ start:129 stop:272 length:144 start_codon:yes stop_codon:yes gene_type:complete